MAAQGRRRAEAVRRRHHLGLDRRNAVRHRQHQPQRGLQTQLVRGPRLSREGAFPGQKASPARMIHHCRTLAQMRTKSTAQMETITSSCGGRPRSPESEPEELPMNATIRPEQIDEPADADTDLAAVSEVE